MKKEFDKEVCNPICVTVLCSTKIGNRFLFTGVYIIIKVHQIDRSDSNENSNQGS